MEKKNVSRGDTFFWFDALESTIDGLLLIDEQANIVRSSAEINQWIATSAKNLLGKSLPKVAPQIHKAITGLGEAESTEITLDLPNETEKIIRISCRKLVAPAADYQLISIHDLTETKKLEQHLEDSQNQFNAVFTESVETIIIINEKGIIQKANPATIAQFGYSMNEIEGRNVSMLMPEPHRSRHDHYLSNYLSTHKAKIIGIGREVEGQRKDGGLFPMRLSVSEVVTDDGSFFTGTVLDLSEQKTAEAEVLKLNNALEEKVKSRTKELSRTVNKLLSSNKKLEQVIQQREKITEALKQSERELKTALSKEKELGDLKSRFVSMASHEFRTPLSSILSSSELVQMVLAKNKPEKAEKYLKRIDASVNTLTGILNDFLSLSKLEEGRTSVELEEFLFSDFCQEIRKEYQPLLKKGQELFVDSATSDFTIYTDRRILKNILINLISNASKYSKENKPIICSIAANNQAYVISIKDEGIGIPADDIPHLFSRFFRASNAVNIQGTGLGLNIIKRYLNLLGGTIDMTSELNVGSTFTITLPFKPSMA